MKAYRLIYIGKTKDTFSVKNKPDLFIMHFKNNILGKKGLPDSGGNEVIGSVPGKGKACSFISGFFLSHFKKNKIRTHLVKVLPNYDIVVKKTKRIPIEFICRNYAYGTYLERFPKTKAFKPLGGLIEFSLKSDEAGDPFLTKEQVMDFVGEEELKKITGIIKKINSLVTGFCLKIGIELIDFKVEFGKLNGQIILIDDFSTDTARFSRNKKLLSPFELSHDLKMAP